MGAIGDFLVDVSETKIRLKKYSCLTDENLSSFKTELFYYYFYLGRRLEPQNGLRSVHFHNKKLNRFIHQTVCQYVDDKE